MASFDPVTQASQSILDTIRGFTTKQQEGQQKIKQDYGFDQRVQNLEGLRRAAFDTEKLLSDLPKNVQQRARGRLITAGQQNRMLSSEQQPLAGQLANISRGREAEQSGLDLVRGLLGDYSSDTDKEFQREYEAGRMKREDAMTAYQGEVAREEAERQRQFQAEQARAQQALAWAQYNAQQEQIRRQESLQQAIMNARLGLNPDGSPKATAGGSNLSVRVGDQAADTSLGGTISRAGQGIAAIPANIGALLNKSIWSANPELGQQRTSFIQSSPFLNDLSMRLGDFTNWATGSRDFRGYQ